MIRRPDFVPAAPVTPNMAPAVIFDAAKLGLAQVRAAALAPIAAPVVKR